MTRLWNAKWFTSRQALFFLLCASGLYAINKGQDAAWDLKNYHLYNAWAFFHGRLAIDLGAAGLQGYFNPILDVPYIWLGLGWLHQWPRLLSGLQGLWYGVLVFVVIKIAARYAEIRGRIFGISDLMAVMIGITGTMVTSQTGSSTNEVPLALLIVLGFYVALPLTASMDLRKSSAVMRAALSGALCGLAAGLKPTAIVYVPAMAFALWFALNDRRAAYKLSLAFTCASVISFAVAYGWWGLTLYRLTGNPIFPMFNQFFHSPWVPAVGGTDRQFMPKFLIQWIFYPFYWIYRNAYQGGGNKFSDSRYAIAMLAAVVLVIMATTKRFKVEAGSFSIRFILFFMILSYVLWLNLFSILRYTVPIEVLTGLLILFSLQEVLARVNQIDAERWTFWSMIVMAALIIGFTRNTDWGHAPYSNVAFDVNPPAVPEKSIVLIVGQPNAYVAPFFSNAKSLRFVGVTWLSDEADAYLLGALTRKALSSPTGDLYALTRDANIQDQAQLRRILPSAHLVECRQVKSAMERTKRGTDLSDGLRLCRVDPLPSSTMPITTERTHG